jgi:hypothetical protein
MGGEDGIDGVVNGGVKDGQVASGEGGGTIVGADGVDHDGVPGENRIKRRWFGVSRSDQRRK